MVYGGVGECKNNRGRAPVKSLIIIYNKLFTLFGEYSLNVIDVMNGNIFIDRSLFLQVAHEIWHELLWRFLRYLFRGVFSVLPCENVKQVPDIVEQNFIPTPLVCWLQSFKYAALLWQLK